MTARRKTAGRNNRNRKVAGAVLAISAAALLLATEAPQGLSKAVGGSTALAELAARSPGARIGGVALKAKSRRSALAPVASAAAPGGEAPGTAVASVLGTSAGPEGAVPTSGPIGPGGFPNDFLAPPVPGPLGPVGGVPSGTAPGIDFGGVPGPQIGGLPIFVGGGPSGGGGGGGGGGTGTLPPDDDDTPGGGTLVPPPPTPIPGAGPIPEPSTWLMLIAGFGFIGGAMRRGGRVRLA